MDACFKMAMAVRVAPSGGGSRSRMLLWRCALMAGLISTLLGGGSAQVTTSSLASLTTATSTVNRLTASTTYTPTASWTPAATCSAGSSAVGGYGGGVYLDGYGTYWSVACGYDWDGTTFHDGAGISYVSWRALWCWVVVLTFAGLWAPPAEAYTIASGDARPGLAASPSPLLGPLTQRRRQPKVLASVSKFAQIDVLGIGPLLTLSQPSLSGHSGKSLLQWQYIWWAIGVCFGLHHTA